jgi:hypothetical protein
MNEPTKPMRQDILDATALNDTKYLICSWDYHWLCSVSRESRPKRGMAGNQKGPRNLLFEQVYSESFLTSFTKPFSKVFSAVDSWFNRSFGIGKPSGW